MSFLPNDEFLSSLQTILVDPSKSIYITQKRLTEPKVEPTIDDLSANITGQALVVDYKTDESAHQILFKVKTDRKKIRTVVNAEDLDAFWIKYSGALKNGFTGLKKTKKKKKKAKKA
ncbi:unnamed protein product [Kuraishia capsulata CBS 1993]|uniref:Signal recognition particle subunit SRP14 n=1 Tax=Kuraishia capsulata CBS 1993 TaxID=1382522 RepID=W6MJL8_9ASCO|nr:uncharacterized protein KUCA_T00002144001 [Kuraishia capsulata CBS 1993]CDK26173.1 unnamed protein product [Kuraishia capsulata CBS 1993]